MCKGGKMKSLNQISFIDSSGNEIKLSANNTKEAAVDQTEGTVPLRDASGRFRVGDTDVSSTDGYVVINKNYADGRISNAINALDKSDAPVTGEFVSAVSEENGIITVSRRRLVESDGVVLLVTNQTITGSKTFYNGLRCNQAPSTDIDVVRKQDISKSKIRVFNQWDSINTTSAGQVTWGYLSSFLLDGNSVAVTRLKKTAGNTTILCSCQIGYTTYNNRSLITSITIEIPEGFADLFGGTTREKFDRGSSGSAVIINSHLLPYLQAQQFIYDNPW